MQSLGLRLAARWPLLMVTVALVAALVIARSNDPRADTVQSISPSPASATLYGPAPPTLLPPGFVWTRAHDEALKLHTDLRGGAPLVFRSIAGGRKHVDEITNSWGLPLDQTLLWRAIRELEIRGLIQAPFAGDWSTPELSPYGRQVLQALGEIPEAVKEYAVCWGWFPEKCPLWYYPLPPYYSPQEQLERWLSKFSQ